MISIKRILSFLLLSFVFSSCLLLYTPSVNGASVTSIYINSQSWIDDAVAPLEIIHDEYYIPVDALGMFPYINVVNKTDNGGTFIIKNIVTGEYFSAICRINRVFSSESNLPIEVKIESIQQSNRNYYYVPLAKICELLRFSFDSYTFESGFTCVRIKDDTELVDFKEYLQIIFPNLFDEDIDVVEKRKLYLIVYGLNEYTHDLCKYANILNVEINYLISYEDLLNNLDLCLDVISYNFSIGITFNSNDNLSWLCKTSNLYTSNYLNMNVHNCFTFDNQNYNFSYETSNYYYLGYKYIFDDNKNIDDMFMQSYNGNVIIVLQCDDAAQEKLSQIYNAYINNRYGELEFSKISYLK